MDRTVVVQAPLLSHIVALRPNEIAARVEHGRERERRRADAEVDEVRRPARVDGRRRAVTAARMPLARWRGGPVSRREETAGVEPSTCVRSSRMPRPGLLGRVKNGNWNSRQRRNHRLEAIGGHGTKRLVSPAVWIDS